MRMGLRAPNSAADIAKMLESMGVDRIIAIDLHSSQIDVNKLYHKIYRNFINFYKNKGIFWSQSSCRKFGSAKSYG